MSSGVGGIAETDISLAMATNAVIFGFNVRADTASKRLVEQEGLDLRYYSIIYNLIDDVKAALTGMLAPEFREDIVGIADVRDVFRSPKFGQVAGCMVTEGNVYRNKPIDHTAVAPAEPEKQPRTARVSELVMQADMFASLEPSKVEECLADLDVDGLTPRDALNRLYELKELLGK